jgi:LmbE family N-acetylglucosaminyl deacetylase
MESHEPPRLLVLGAHPDDAEFHAGGLIAAYCRAAYPVRIVSVTNGCSGHHFRQPRDLVNVRRQEAAAVSALIGAEYEVWDFPDGSLEATLEVRSQIIRSIRTFQPDLVLTHRTNDYHPDHRAVGQAVQDASYLITVPPVVPDVPALRKDPVVALMTDFFTRPAPLRPDVVLDVSDFFLTIVEMLHCHRSQVYEWLPYNRNRDEAVPEGDEEKKAWLSRWFGERSRAVADRFRDSLCARYGDKRGARIEFAEVYEISEYATPLDDKDRDRLFGGRFFAPGHGDG